MLAAEATSNLTIPALISGAVALVSPALAVARWVQEKSTKHRSREEMRHSREVFEFIQTYPKMVDATPSSNPEILPRAQAELADSIHRIEALLELRAAKKASPLEMTWPRRLLLLYAPRSWGAVALHAIWYVITAFFILGIISLGNNEETDSFLLSEYLRYFHSSLFWLVLSFFAIQAWILWYAAVTKDRWDGTLPTATANNRFFLMQGPNTVRELIARLFLVWSLYDLATSQIFRIWDKKLLQESPLLLQIINAIPKAPSWKHVIANIAAASCPILAYLWAKAEFSGRGIKLRVFFPHNLRFLYPTSGIQDRLARVFIVFFSIYSFLVFLRLQELLSIAVPYVPSEDQGAFLSGFVLSPAIDLIFMGAIPLYAAYRLALMEYIANCVNGRVQKADDRTEGSSAQRQSTIP